MMTRSLFPREKERTISIGGNKAETDKRGQRYGEYSSACEEGFPLFDIVKSCEGR